MLIVELVVKQALAIMQPFPVHLPTPVPAHPMDQLNVAHSLDFAV